MTTSSGTPGGHSAPLSLMSCVRESSPQELQPQIEQEIDRNEPSKKRRFHPFRGLRKIFRRKGRHSGSEETVPEQGVEPETVVPAKESHRSRSTSELLAGDEPARRKSGTPIYPGLSVSHDSVFTADQNSTHSSSDLELDTAQSSSSLSIQQLIQTGVRAELLDVVRRRRGRGDTSEDEEDLGLPRSPCNSPTTTDQNLKDHPNKSHSTCSDGSLLSMGSSVMDEDSFGPNSRHSSKLSLHERPIIRPAQTQVTDTELEFGTGVIAAPLSHSAARHKMAVRPKRTHGAPRRRRTPQLTATTALPTTIEVNEETSLRSITTECTTTRETIAELYSTTSASLNKVWNATVVPEHQLKSASLPPGLALPTSANKLNRSRSNAGTKASKDSFVEEDEEEKTAKEDKKKEESFFGRFLARRSGKKASKKSKSEDTHSVATSNKTVDVVSTYKQVDDRRTNSVDSGVKTSVRSMTVSSAPRSGPASRQRIQPIDIPASPDTFRTKRQQNIDIDVPMPPLKNSPDSPSFLEASPPKRSHLYLSRQTKLTEKQMEIEENASDNTIIPTVQLSNKISWPETFAQTKECRSEEKMKVKITGLSSYQQRVLSYDEFDNVGFKSLSEGFEENVTKYSSVTKSHSFRSKSLVTSTQEFPIFPYVPNNDTSDVFHHSYCSKTLISSDEDEKQIVAPETDETFEKQKSCEENIEINEPISFISVIEPIVKPITVENNRCEEQTSEEKNEGVTISCVNSQVQSSVNTQSSNQVIVSISNVSSEAMSESSDMETSNDNLTNQVSITRVQLKRDSKTVETSTVVPEFLKIQLHKVDVKTSSNVVLSTSPPETTEEKQMRPAKNITVETETDRESGEVVMDTAKRKFSKDDVEIIDKELSEEIVEVPTKNIVIPNNAQLKPFEESNNNKKQNTGAVITKTDRKSSLVTPAAAKPLLKIKSNSIELAESTVKCLQDYSEKMTVSTEQLSPKPVLKEKAASVGDIQDTPEPVMLRRKSSASQKRDKDSSSSEEPELMKVFARRSLKLKDSEAETLSQQVMVLVENSQSEETKDIAANRSRDSDKENEFSESPHEERKRTTFQSHATLKDATKPLTESKYVESSEVTLRKPVTNNKILVFNTPKYQQKTVSVPVPTHNLDNQEIRKNKSLFEQKTELKPKIFDKNITRARIMGFKDKDIDIKKSSDLTNNKNSDEVITNVSLKNNEFENEAYVPMFKRIQQRKEEWELRAQQAMKKTIP